MIFRKNLRNSSRAQPAHLSIDVFLKDTIARGEAPDSSNTYQEITIGRMKTTVLCLGLLACLVAAATANSQDSLLRVSLQKRTLDIQQVKSSRAALLKWSSQQQHNALVGEAEEADIPLLDFLDAQCKRFLDYDCPVVFNSIL